MNKQSQSLTPMMQQFFAIKAQYPDFLIFFRLGDFYELFEEDAVKASQALQIHLTKRQNYPMCGFPHHAKDNYIHKLIHSHYKIAICEQEESLQGAKKIFNRKVVELITPGTFVRNDLQKDDTAYFLMSLSYFKKQICTCFIDVSTGKCLLSEILPENQLHSLMEKFPPSEIVYHKDLDNYLSPLIKDFYTTLLEDHYFDIEDNTRFLKQHFNIQTLSSLDINHSLSIQACASSLKYIHDTLLTDISYINHVEVIHNKDFVYLPDITIKNLELTQAANSNIDSSLYTHLNKTHTAMGSRYLRQFITHPLKNSVEIERRLDCINYLIENTKTFTHVEQYLKNVPDIEKILSKMALKKSTPADIWNFGLALSEIENIKKLLHCDIFLPIKKSIQYITELIQNHLVDNPSTSFGDEPTIQSGISAQLDLIRDNSIANYTYLVKIEEKAQKETGLDKLKLKYNKNNGYYFEISKLSAKKLPNYFVKKQSLTNVERFTTEELLGFETQAIQNKNILLELEIEIFDKMNQSILESITLIKQHIEWVKNIDIMFAFTKVSMQYNYTRPSISGKQELIINGGRHPVVEKFVEHFITNSIHLDNKENRLLIITGPNMGGKSTLLRQTALITLMAHIGCFVPCKQAIIPIVDKIFTRVGASDNLAKGESTFLVEMSETAYILNHATAHSLIIMDEIGRGTSTYDGMSLALAIAQYLVHPVYDRGMTLFATHYHEIATLEQQLGAKNFHVSIKEEEDKLIFLHKLTKGPASKSYGLHVAKMAGISIEVLEEAEKILQKISNEKQVLQNSDTVKSKNKLSKQENTLLTHTMLNITQKIQSIDTSKMTPIEAILFLDKLKQQTKKELSYLNSDQESLFL